jgi:uncharacterized protein
MEPKMPHSLHQSSVPVFEQLLTSLAAIIDKAIAYATARKIDPAVLVSARLYPDMLPFVNQVQIACDHAKFVAGRLSGGDAPRFQDSESSLEEIKARIEKTLTYIRSVSASSIDEGAEREITVPLGAARTMKMKGSDYFNHFALPNFYFHCTTAYDILRHNGLEIGKRDFVGTPKGASIVEAAPR